MIADWRKRMHDYYFHPDKNEPMCANCEHFYMHYIRRKQRYECLHEGHCVTPQMKNRQAWDVCPHFTPKAASAPAPAQTK